MHRYGACGIWGIASVVLSFLTRNYANETYTNILLKTNVIADYGSQNIGIGSWRIITNNRLKAVLMAYIHCCTLYGDFEAINFD